MKSGTVCFFTKDNQVMLAKIHYPDGNERWNGVGGVVDPGETPEEAVIREIKEEINVGVLEKDLKKMHEFEAEGYNLIVYLTSNWSGEPQLVDPTIKEIKWFNLDQIPYDQMWKGNEIWLPKILKHE